MDYAVSDTAAVTTTHGQEGLEVPYLGIAHGLFHWDRDLESGLSGHNGQPAYHTRGYLRVEGP